jgi:hypothetical protein
MLARSKTPVLILLIGCMLPAQGLAQQHTDSASEGVTAIRAELSPDWFFADGLEFTDQVSVQRSSTLKIRDPHFFAPVLPPIFCPDFTDTDIAGQPNSAINNQIAVTLNTDSDANGFLDSSPLWLFQNALAGPVIRRFDTAAGQCSAPLASTSCSFPAMTNADTYTVIASGTDSCFAPIAGTTGGYSPAVATINSPCFLSAAKPIAALDFNGVSVPLYGVRSGGEFNNSIGPSGKIMLRGFLRESDANAVILPASVPLVGGRPLSVLLKGGTGSCATGSDKDNFEGVPGWWFYLEQTIAPVPVTP